jgi:signal transduction histidine kinase
MNHGSGDTRSRTARIMEQVLRRLLEDPSVFTYAALAISTAIALRHGLGSLRSAVEWLVLLVAFVGWVHVWSNRRGEDPGARSPLTIILAFAGTLVLAALSARDLSYTIVATTLLPQYFTMLPLPVAALAFFPMFFASEYSHTVAVLADPSGFPWTMAFIRGAAVVLIGISFKVLAMQMRERSQLRASLVMVERRSGMLEERQRLAREIHDTLAQGFASIIVHFERAEQIDPMTSSPAKPHLDLARSVAREGLEEARRMLAALRPEILEQQALPEALGRVCQEWSRRTGVQATLSITGVAAPMHPDIELTLLRATQEALTNIGRHAGAKTAAVTLSYMEDVAVLDVQDDGKGFTPSSARGAGFGLTGMRERAESLEGTFSLESVPGEGTTVSISLPMVRSTGTFRVVEGLAK